MTQEGPTESMQELLRNAINHQLTEFHVCMPGKIEAYNPLDGTATVKPTLSRRFRGAEDVTEYPVISKVPVIQPRVAKARINFPIEPGDLCLIVFADRNIENWLQSDGARPKAVNDIRQHDLSDAFAILGGYPFLKPAPSKNPGALSIEVEPGIKVAITNGSVELLDLLDQLLKQINLELDAMTAHFHIGFAGIPTVPPDAGTLATIIQIKLEVTKIKTLLGTIKV